MFNLKNYLVTLLLISSTLIQAHTDLTLMGRVMHSDGLCRIPITVAEMLKDDLSINFHLKDYYDLHNIPEDVKKLMVQNARATGQVLLYCDSLWTEGKNSTNVMVKAQINIAYSMLESTKIPQTWVKILNNKFDAVAVPDSFLIEVYKNCGVKIPIFVLPLALNLDPFLNTPLKQKQNEVFVFGTSASFSPGKNHETLLDAFIAKFGNNPKVKLLIHGRWGEQHIIDSLHSKIKKANISNVEIIQKIFTPDEYLSFFKQLDCYVLVSKGEGFSVTPREALALGLPCVISNNTAHKTICDTGLVYSVPSDVLEKAIYHGFGNQDCGYKFCCHTKDVLIGLSAVYDNYPVYLRNSENARIWAAQYSYQNLQKYYLNLIKPKNVLLDKLNIIAKDNLITQSRKLYDKYKKLI